MNKDINTNKDQTGGSKNAQILCEKTSFDFMNKLQQMGGQYKIYHQNGGSFNEIIPPLKAPSNSPNQSVVRSNVPTAITPYAANDFVYPSYYQQKFNPLLKGGKKNKEKKDKEYTIIKNRKYVLRYGERGGKYIMKDGKKHYL